MPSYKTALVCVSPTKQAKQAKQTSTAGRRKTADSGDSGDDTRTRRLAVSHLRSSNTYRDCEHGLARTHCATLFSRLNDAFRVRSYVSARRSEE